MRIELDECGPFCNAGTHHVKLVMELRNGKEQTRTGNYYKSLEEAEKQIAVFVEGGEKNPALVRVSPPLSTPANHRGTELGLA